MSHQVERPTNPLDYRHAAAPPVRNAETARAPALPAEERVGVNAQHGATQAMVPREQIAQPVGQAEHPLTHRDPRQHGIDQMRL